MDGAEKKSSRKKVGHNGWWAVNFDINLTDRIATLRHVGWSAPIRTVSGFQVRLHRDSYIHQ